MMSDIDMKYLKYDSRYWETVPKDGHPNRYRGWDKKAIRQRELMYTIKYLKMQVPLLRIMFSEYKVKWEKSQRLRKARYDKVAIEESEYLTDTSNGTVTSNIAFGFPNAEVDDDVNIEPEDTESYRPGYYLLISYEQGGWTYPQVKRYFWLTHGVRCFRSKTIKDALKGTNYYKALVKFRSLKALNDVYRMLTKEKK